MHFARIQDFSGEEPSSMPENAPTSLQAVMDTLAQSSNPLTADNLIEGLFRRGYAILPVHSCQANQIFKGDQV